ncbi:MAG: hypothetical protein NT062_37205 [Proteobacteria bacterium]|nr:hypothetical protein [Pseudomonadota bacterium]
MNVTSVDPANAYAVRMARVAQDQQRADGKSAVALIEQVPSTPDVEGKGQHVNTYG